MSDLKRREILQIFGTAPAVAALTWTDADAAQAAQSAQQARTRAAAAKQAYKPKFFTARELAMVTALADIIIPKDERSGSASEAGVPEFIDYIVSEQGERQTAMRGGLAWLDSECRKRFDKAFLTCAAAERLQVLDDIAWPRKARGEMSHGVRFFSSLRDLVAAGFFSSKMGVADLQYMGNLPAVWDGPPAAALQKLGLTSE